MDQRLFRLTSRMLAATAAVLLSAGCGEGMSEEGQENIEPASVGEVQSAATGIAVARVRVFNNSSSSLVRGYSTINSGYYSPSPWGSILAYGYNEFQHYTYSFNNNRVQGQHNYSIGAKNCRFEYLAYPITPTSCSFNHSAWSTGTTFAYCYATLETVDHLTCSMTVRFTMF